MKKILLIFLVIICILILIGGFFYLTSTNEGKEAVKKIQKSFSEIINKDQDKDDKSTYVPTSQGAGGGGGDSGGAGGGSSSELTCITKSISYSILNIEKNSVCNEYQNETCLNKTITCSSEVHNRDLEISGFFEMELKFVEEIKNIGDPLETRTSRFFLNPGEYESLGETLTIIGTDENSSSNKIINCFHDTIEIPTKQVCS